MARPSIFSSEYNRRMRRRKIKITLLVTLVVLIGAVAFAEFKYNAFNVVGTYVKKEYNKILAGKNAGKNVNPDKQNSTTDKNQGTNNVDKSLNKPGEATEDQGYAVTLSNGKQGKAVYESKDGVKSFRIISPIESGIYYNISTDGKNMIIFDDSNQTITCLDVEGNKTDLTRTEYVSDDGTVYPKSDRLAKEPSYIWHSSPKFIDSENVAYISQLPWFNKQLTKYVWIVNIKDKSHRYIGNLSGDTLTFGELSEKGLNVKVGDKDFYLKGNGEVTE